MKAAIFEGPPGSWPGKPLKVQEIPCPSPDVREVLVRVSACGICRTDLDYLKEGLRPPGKLPLVLGHEASGIVEQTGEGVKSYRRGDRVIICCIVPCGHCRPCMSGRENLCDAMDIIGASRHGAYAEHVAVPEKALVKLLPEIPLESGSLLSESLPTSYHAICDIGSVSAGNTVAIFGATGGLGLAAVQICSALGARTIAIGRTDWKLDMASKFGAWDTISAARTDRVDEKIIEVTHGGADAAIDMTGNSRMMEMACRSTRPGGKTVIVGYGMKNFEVPAKRLMWYELQVLGSRAFTHKNVLDVMRMVQEGRIRLDDLISHRLCLDEINEAFKLLDAGSVIRALVIP